MRRVAVGCALFAGLACFASAETVYRCGNSYSQLPCDGGRALDATDRRSARHVDEARRVAEMERKLGDSLERERERQERAGSRAGGPASLSRDRPVDQQEKASKSRQKDFSVKLPKPKKNARTP